MPSEKSFRASLRKAGNNRDAKGAARTAIAAARHAIEQGDPQEAQAVNARAASALDRAAKRGAIHRNNAARRKSRLAKALRSREQGTA
ncbi:MAG: 30S ribosomal protein S20 [Chloroflexi bacterium]|nr:30S ribosomal protein S20 [Chloroflexota bacterium]